MERENEIPTAAAANPSRFILGTLVGAGIAVLFAPYAGSELRRFLRDYAGRAQYKLAEGVNRGVEYLDKAFDQGEKFIEKGKKSLSETDYLAKRYTERRQSVLDAIDELSSQRH